MTRADKFANATREDWMTDELLDSIKTVSKEGKITCVAAQQFARDNGIPMNKMNSLLNFALLKVQSCQLGCF